ncbi:MAG: peptide chain release factor 1 [Leptospirales bacterium]|nr:peptide chain release factor 1 [Leptospirales bacterium]
MLKDRLEREIERFREIEEKLSSGELSTSELRETSRLHAQLGPRVAEMQEYLRLSSELQQAEAMLRDSTDAEMREMAREEVASLQTELEGRKKRIERLLIPPDPRQGRSLILEIRAGTGGDEAALFASDLTRMYLRFAERRGLPAEMISLSESDLGGYKEAVFSIAGAEAYDLLHQEGGAHRVQRIPVTESGGRIHTSAVTVAVMPEVEQEEVTINDKDLIIDTIRASGAGGQHVNKTESAVRVRHVPSGIMVYCQDERSQHKNMARAMRILRARLAEKQESERHAAEAALKKEQVKSGDRSERIRTYNFPQGRVTDHRIGFTAYNLSAFLDGEMDELLEALLEAEREQKLKLLAI